LQIEKEFHFDHPKLAPQFFPNIPCYKASYSKRISAVVERYVPFFSWTSHLNNQGGTGFQPVETRPGWPSHSAAAAAAADLQWVALEASLQWRFFQSSVKILKARANTVFVLVGPFNEHMLQGQSVDTYRKMKEEIVAWLNQNDVPYYIPPVLASKLYRDVSHPLSEGYAMLAKQLFENESFRSSILQK